MVWVATIGEAEPTGRGACKIPQISNTIEKTEDRDWGDKF